MARKRATQMVIAIIALILVGTGVVLSSVSYYLAIDPAAYLSEQELLIPDGYNGRLNASQEDRVPRIIHQTWKTDELPERWRPVSQSCRELMPDYEYMLWNDDRARQFIADHYAWFLRTYDGYIYNIQRADAIRYFVLHHYGGVYIDIDIGCRRPADALLRYPIILPKTIPVGISNDLMFAEKGHPFFAQTIRRLAAFDHNWIINYPTVMFSTGPMFLSAQMSVFAKKHPQVVRVLPKALYGKNAKPGEAPHSFFDHFYGSSWHEDDAGFIWFLAKKGMFVVYAGLAIVFLGLVRLLWPKSSQFRGSRRLQLYWSGMVNKHFMPR